MADERIELKLDLGQSVESAKQLGAALQGMNAAARDVAATYEVLAISGQGYELVEQRVESRLAKTAAATAQFTAAMNRADASTKNFGSRLMQTGYVVDDFVAGTNQGGGLDGIARGLANIQNNLPGLLLSFGLGSGLAGVLGIAGVAFAQLLKHLDQLPISFRDANIDAQAKAMEEFAKSTGDANKALDAQIAALRNVQTAGKPEQADIVKAAIGEAGGVDDVTNATRNAMLAESPEVAAATKNANDVMGANAGAASNAANPIAQLKALVAIKKANRERDEATAKVELLTKALVVKASQGDADAIRELDRLNPGGSFGQALPENIRAQDAEVEAADDQGDVLHQAGVKRRAGAARDAAESKAADKAKAAAVKAAQKTARSIVVDKPEILQKQPMMKVLSNEEFAIQAMQNVIANQAAAAEQLAAQGAKWRQIRDESRAVRAQYTRNRK